MVGDPYEAIDDPDCYPGTSVLRNIPDLRTAEELENFELEMVALRVEEGTPAGHLTCAHYRAIHRHLFQDVYSWAGRYRNIRTGKGGSWFAYPEYIKPEMNNLFTRLGSAPFQPGARLDQFIPALAEFVGDLNAIHPFREGNGRTQLIFIRLIGQSVGHPFRLESVEPEEFLAAMIDSFHGRMDALIDELERMLA